jgi:hypothetical protein
MPLTHSSSSSHHPARPAPMNNKSVPTGRDGTGRFLGRRPGPRRGERLVSFLSAFDTPVATGREPNLTVRELLIAVYQMPGTGQVGRTWHHPGSAR